MRRCLQAVCGPLPYLAAAAAVLLPADAALAQSKFRETKGSVSMEAESANTKGKWKWMGSAEGVSKAYMVSSGTKNRKDALTFEILFTRAGRYRVWLRCAGPTDRSNACYVLMNGKQALVKAEDMWEKVWGVETSSKTWGWDSTAAFPDMPLEQRQNGCHVNVAMPGSHTLTIGSLKKGFGLDKVVLILEGRGEKTAPAGLGPDEELNLPIITSGTGTSANLRAAEGSAAAGNVGKAMRILQWLADPRRTTETGNRRERQQASFHMSVLTGWVKLKEDLIDAYLESGRAVTAYAEADELEKALDDHPMQKQIKTLKNKIRAGRNFKIGIKFYSLKHSTEYALKEYREKKLKKFAENYPDSYHGKLAAEMVE